MEGEGRWARYRANRIEEAAGSAAGRAEALLPLSEDGAEIQRNVRQPPKAREPVGYERAFLEAYRPKESFYLSTAERAHLREVGTPSLSARMRSRQRRAPWRVYVFTNLSTPFECRWHGAIVLIDGPEDRDESRRDCRGFAGAPVFTERGLTDHP